MTQFGSRGVAGARVLLISLETAIDFSRYTPIIRCESRYGNGEEYERDALTNATLEPRHINRTIGILYSSRAL